MKNKWCELEMRLIAKPALSWIFNHSDHNTQYMLSFLRNFSRNMLIVVMFITKKRCMLFMLPLDLFFSGNALCFLRFKWISDDWFWKTWNKQLIRKKGEWIEWCFSGCKYMMRYMNITYYVNYYSEGKGCQKILKILR